MKKNGLLFLVFFIASCSSPGLKYSLDDVAKAESAGQLPAFYDNLSEMVSQGKGGEDARSLMISVGKRLSDQMIVSYSASLAELRSGYGAIAYDKIPSIAPLKTKIQRWNSADVYRLIEIHGQEVENTGNKINKNKKKISSVKFTDPLLAMKIARDNNLLFESEKEKVFLQDLTAELASHFYLQGSDYSAAGDYDQALEAYSLVSKIQKNYRNVNNEINLTRAAIFSQEFILLLEQGEADAAHKKFIEASGKPSFDKIKKELKSTVSIMRGFFAQMGAESSENKEYYTAYIRFSQADELMQLMGMEDTEPTPQKRDFIAFMLALAEKVHSQGRPGVALGLTKVVEKLSPKTRNRVWETKQNRHVRRVLRQAHDDVERVAIKGISTSTFKHSVDHASLGSAIASRVSRYLFNEIPADVRIVE